MPYGKVMVKGAVMVDCLQLVVRDDVPAEH